MEFHSLSLLDLVETVRSGRASAGEVYAHFADRVAAHNADVRAFTTVNPAPAAFADPSTPLAGIPIGIKDVYCERGIRTTASSRMLENFIPPYDATIISRLKAAGFSSLGKVTMDEFAMGGSGEKSAFDVARNPWDTARIPGGSSSGSAAAVAAGLVPAAFGTDTGGSIRQPASMCGMVGFKPTYGRNSRSGIIAMASSLDTPGTITRTVRDAAYLYGITAGLDPADSTTLADPVSVDPAIWDAERLDGVRVGVPKEYFVDGTEPGVRREIMAAIDRLASLGATIEEVSLPNVPYSLAVYYVVMPAEASTNLARYDGIRYGHSESAGMDIAANRAAGFGREPQRRIMLGSFVLSSGFYDAYYRRASLVRELIRDDFRKAFERYDVLVAPTAPSVAWKLGENVTDPVKLYLEDIFTVPASLAGLPALTLPVGYAASADGQNDRLPVGLQIMGARLGEEKVFKVAHVLERSLGNLAVTAPKFA